MYDHGFYGIYNHMTQTSAPGVTIVNTPASPFYDAAGNVIYDGGNQYLYDAEGRVCAVNNLLNSYSMTGYVYDAEGNRTATGVITSWSCDPTANGFTETSGFVVGPGGQQLTEVGNDGDWKHTNVWAGAKLIATYDDNIYSGLHLHIDDPLGTRRAQTDVAGTLEMVYQSLPYGDGFSLNQISNSRDSTRTTLPAKKETIRATTTSWHGITTAERDGSLVRIGAPKKSQFLMQSSTTRKR